VSLTGTEDFVEEGLHFKQSNLRRVSDRHLEKEAHTLRRC
jgi:hypothetical protein